MSLSMWDEASLINSATELLHNRNMMPNNKNICLNSNALRKTKIVCNFGLSECISVATNVLVPFSMQ